MVRKNSLQIKCKEFFLRWTEVSHNKARNILVLMMFFFNRTGLEHAGVVGLDLDSCWARLQALDRRVEDRSVTELVCRLWV